MSELSTVAGASVAAKVLYNADAENFTAEVNEIAAAKPDAVILVAFNETTKIIPQMIAKGLGPDKIKVYFVDGNLAGGADHRRIRVDVPEIEVHPGAGPDPHRARAALGVVPGVLQRRPGAVQEQPLLGVHGLRLGGRDGKEGSIEQTDIFLDEMTPSHGQTVQAIRIGVIIGIDI